MAYKCFADRPLAGTGSVAACTGSPDGAVFAHGMRHFFDNPIQRAYAWAANGCAAVLTSILAAYLALSLGIPLLAAAAARAYTLAYVCLKAIGLRTEDFS